MNPDYLLILVSYHFPSVFVSQCRHRLVDLDCVVLTRSASHHCFYVVLLYLDYV